MEASSQSGEANAWGPPLKVTGAWLIRPRQAPLKDPAVVIDEDGRVEWVGTAPDAPALEDHHVWHVPGGIIAPGFINTHTHLELSHLAGTVNAESFPLWLMRVRQLKDRTTTDEFYAASCLGISEMWAQGVTTVGDTGSTGAPALALSALGGRGIYYQEVFGVDPRDTDSALASLHEQVDRLSDCSSEQLRIGVSPHAPYTVSDALAAAVFEFAAASARPVAIHVAESIAEHDFMLRGAGPFGDWQMSLGVAPTIRQQSAVQWLHDLGGLAHAPLCIHCVTVSDSDIALFATHDVPVAHCPLSNRAHAHGSAPLEALRSGGVRVGLGTDSVVSQAPLDLRAEARATSLSMDEQFEMLTSGGASTLGLGGACGDVRRGGWGDLVIFDGGKKLPEPTAWASAPVAGTLVGGRVVYRRDGLHRSSEAEWRLVCDRARARLLRT